VNLNDLTIATDNLDQPRLLNHWQWLLPDQVEVLLVTKTADCFLLEPETGHILFLDTNDGELEHIASDFDEFRSVLADPEFITDYFSLLLMAPLLETPLPENAVFALATPPVLGGSFETDELTLVDIYQYFDEMGALWQKLSQIELPDDAANEPGSASDGDIDSKKSE